MREMIKEFGIEPVQITIKKAVTKCCAGLNIHMDPGLIDLLVEDLVDVYKYDSVEDIIECLKKGRQGKYGFGHNSRSALTMILIGEWMAKHLEEKAIAREKELQNQKKKDVPEIIKNKEGNEIDMYEAYRRRQAGEKKKEKLTNEQENEFQRLRLEYLKNSQKSEDKAGPIEKGIKENAPDK